MKLVENELDTKHWPSVTRRGTTYTYGWMQMCAITCNAPATQWFPYLSQTIGLKHGNYLL